MTFAIDDIVRTKKGAAFWGKIIAFDSDTKSPGCTVLAIAPGFEGTKHVYPLAQLEHYSPSLPVVPAFEGVARRKLEDLMERGWEISGYSIFKEDRHGLVTAGAFVGWWSVAVENAEKDRQALAEAEAKIGQLTEVLSNIRSGLRSDGHVWLKTGEMIDGLPWRKQGPTLDAYVDEAIGPRPRFNSPGYGRVEP